MKTRKVYPGEVHHICQQTVGGVLAFYSAADFLVFFSIVCTVAGRYGIRLLALCPMVDHTHIVVVAPGETALARFVQQYTCLFSREWNQSRGRKGPLFKHRYMSSVKLGNKQARTTINYCNNNPVERKVVTDARDYRWNFLRYARETHPYSPSLNLSKLPPKVRNILREGDPRDVLKSAGCDLFHMLFLTVQLVHGIYQGGSDHMGKMADSRGDEIMLVIRKHEGDRKE